VVNAALLGFLAVRAAPALPVGARVALGIGAVGSLVWAGVSLAACRRGHLRRLTDPVILVNTLFVVFAFATAIGSWLALSLPDRAKGTQILLFFCLFLGMASGFLLRTVVEQAELRTRQKLLEIEMQVQRLAEVLRRNSISPDENTNHKQSN
jgi:hypothetical protein